MAWIKWSDSNKISHIVKCKLLYIFEDLLSLLKGDFSFFVFFLQDNLILFFFFFKLQFIVSAFILERIIDLIWVLFFLQFKELLFGAFEYLRFGFGYAFLGEKALLCKFFIIDSTLDCGICHRQSPTFIFTCIFIYLNLSPIDCKSV